MLARRGALAVVGGEGGNPWTGGFLESMVATSAMSLWSSQKLRTMSATVTADDLLVLKELVEAGKLPPALGRRYALEEGVEESLNRNLMGYGIITQNEELLSPAAKSVLALLRETAWCRGE